MKNINIILVCLSALFFTRCNEKFDNPEFKAEEFHVYNWTSSSFVPLNDTLKVEAHISPLEGTEIKWYLNNNLEENFTNNPIYNYIRPRSAVDDSLTMHVKRGNRSRKYTIILSPQIDVILPKVYKQKVVGFLSTNGKDTDIDWKSLTHLILSSALVQADGSLDAKEVQKEIDINKIINASRREGVYVMLSISDKINSVTGRGGWGNADFIKAIEDGNQDKLIANIISFLKENKFYGVNIDCNLTNPILTEEQVAKVKSFVEELSKALPDKEDGGKMLLSMNVYPVWNDAVLKPWATLSQVDWFNTVAYGFDEIKSAHHALFDITFVGGSNKWIGYGVPKEKIVPGLPAYGVRYEWPTDGTEVTWGNAWNYTSHLSYKEIILKNPGFEEDATKGYGYINEASGIFFDGLVSVEKKAKEAKTQNWGGIAIYSIEQDTKDHTSLVKKAFEILNY